MATRSRAAPTSIVLPPPPDIILPTAETALYQHTPSPSARVKAEWEPGCQPDEVYDRVLPSWRAALRRWLVVRLRKEKEWMSAWQGRVRTTARDRYFYWTAVFGTHTFFLTFLPMFFFYGFPDQGRNMLYVAGLGTYLSSFAKDLVCTPRPYSPPMVRLTMSTHHHEYGFPSSHSTSAVSIALLASEWLFRHRDQVGWSALLLGWSFLAVYMVSVAGGRLYTGMHSTADVIGGSLIGAICWLLIAVFGAPILAWLDSGSSLVPGIMVPLILALVHYHPEPVDDCPCFEDAIAFISVILGSCLSSWFMATHPSFVSPDRVLGISEYHVTLRPLVALVRVLVGMVILFAWRFVAKSSLLRVLPPVFRAFSSLLEVDLPTRKHYMSAQDYSGFPQTPVGAIPSFVDLHGMGNDSPSVSTDNSPETEKSAFLQVGDTKSSSLAPPGSGTSGALRQRKAQGSKSQESKDASQSISVRGHRRPRIKFDAEVLTKFGVYTGIGFLATAMIPALFDLIERRVR
ncbi:phosphatidic acid phosphatase type 2/haloperoxidase [Naematelia encephala]|uniref:Phosphatidic acid phosphatase type 2/haloperoxidase n=1 Tax=Naematelia encephala TaxID=71784 RepID=A0A1Y2AUR7_9TREE|nr:phosphatidic acid phosphatase type 2/haloperoxidase [Naematelia encephala]